MRRWGWGEHRWDREGRACGGGSWGEAQRAANTNSKRDTETGQGHHSLRGAQVANSGDRCPQPWLGAWETLAPGVEHKAQQGAPSWWLHHYTHTLGTRSLSLPEVGVASAVQGAPFPGREAGPGPQPGLGSKAYPPHVKTSPQEAFRGECPDARN